MMKLKWHWLTFDELSVGTLYDYLRLRQQVFIIEQKCIYPDLDHQDQSAWHLLGLTEGDNLACCLRLLAPDQKYSEPTLGRIIVAPEFRAQRIGHQLLEEGLKQARKLYPELPIRVQAQAHLKQFYASHGFAPHGDVYDEDGVAHIDMLTTP